MAPRRVSALATAVVLLGTAQPDVAEAQVTGRVQEKLAPAFVDRSLVLPQLWLTTELGGSLLHLEGGFGGPTRSEYQGGWLDVGGAIGVLDDLELEATVVSMSFGDIGYSPLGFYANLTRSSPFGEVETSPVYWGMAKVGATLRLLATDPAELGLRFRMLVDRDGTVGLNGALPILLHGNGYARIDTGVAVVGRVPTGAGESSPFVEQSASVGLVDVNQNPMGPDAGIPIRVALQPIEELWFGLNTGFGVIDVSVSETIFLPLGASVGATIPLDSVVFDLVGAFNFPELVRPAVAPSDDQLFSNLWQVGLSAKAHFGLPK